MQLHLVPCLRDNYAYVLVDPAGNAVVIDPSEAPPVERALEAHGATLAAIWLTHHHWDHVGGIAELAKRRSGLPVICSKYDFERGRVQGATRGVDCGDSLRFADAFVSFLELPGHTLGALGLLTDGCLFSGDTLFVAGCGRLFEGSPACMQRSLASLRSLPPETRIYCGHEYTEANLRFAATIEPANPKLQQRLSWASTRRRGGQSTMPTTLADELETNPFLRWDQPTVIEKARELGAESDRPADVFAALRAAKDRA